MVVLSAGTVGGCGPAWHYNYDDGLRQARRDGRDLLIFYKDPMDVRSGQMRDALESPTVRDALNGKVRCVLVPSYAPNRSFVAQYGVHDTPALIVVHPDGTYHSLDGIQSPESVASFLSSANAPGQQPDSNPRLPRGPTFEYFNIYERARETARVQNRSLLIIYKWWLDGPSTELIRRISKPEVARYVADAVKCILDWDHPPNRQYVHQYGVGSYPALIMVQPDGRYRALTGLQSVDRIIPFLVATHGGGEVLGQEQGDSLRVVWYSDPNAANVVAQRTGRDLLYFYHSDVSAVSTAASRVFDQSELQPLLSTLVSCRLEWGSRESRELMGRYGVQSVPACVLVRQDGSFGVLQGHITADTVTSLIVGE